MVYNAIGQIKKNVTISPRSRRGKPARAETEDQDGGEGFPGRIQRTAFLPGTEKENRPE